MTLDQIRVLMKGATESAESAQSAPSAAQPAPASIAAASAGGGSGSTLVLPPDLPHRTLPVRAAQPDGATLLYVPMLFGAAQVTYSHGPSGVDSVERLAYVVPVTDGAVPVDWDAAQALDLDVGDLVDGAPAAGATAAVPSMATRLQSYPKWSKDLAAWLYRTRRLALLRSATRKLYSRPGEDEGAFRARLALAGREVRDTASERLRRTYDAKVRALEERIRRAEQAVGREAGQAQQAGVQTAISFGATILGSFLGRKRVSAASVGRATTAARSASRAIEQRQDVARAEETVAALRQELAALEAQFQADAARVPGASGLGETLEPFEVRPKKADIAVVLVALVFVPHWKRPDGALVPAWA